MWANSNKSQDSGRDSVVNILIWFILNFSLFSFAIPLFNLYLFETFTFFDFRYPAADFLGNKLKGTTKIKTLTKLHPFDAHFKYLSLNFIVIHHIQRRFVNGSWWNGIPHSLFPVHSQIPNALSSNWVAIIRALCIFSTFTQFATRH